MAEPRLGREWLSRLQAGDDVVIRGDSRRSPGTRAKISKITNTQIVIDFGNYTLRFRKVDGDECGADRWNPRWLVEPTPERLAEVDDYQRKMKASQYIQNTNWDALPTAALESIAAIIQSAKESPNDRE